MPYLNIKISGTRTQADSARVAALLTDLTAEVLGKKRELTSVAVEWISPEHWFVAQAPVSEQGVATCFLDIKITEGTNSKDQKAAYVAQVFEKLEAMLGPLHPASYVVIDEVRADAWGYQGLTQEHRYIHGKRM